MVRAFSGLIFFVVGCFFIAFFLGYNESNYSSQVDLFGQSVSLVDSNLNK